LNDVIQERVKDILGVVKTQLNNSNLYDIINSGIVITGGTALISGMKEFSSSFFEIPVHIGIPNYEGDFADIVCSPKYASAVGALYFANDLISDRHFQSEPASGIEFGSIIKRIKSIFKNI
jgi:cell division protein FtsA